MTEERSSSDADLQRILDHVVGQPGIFIERGHFARGLLQSWSSREDGYVEVVVAINLGDGLYEQTLGAIDYELTDQWLFASGYVTWGWIHGSETIAEIDRRIAAAGCEGDIRECYAIARTIDGKPALIGGRQYNLRTAD